MLDEVDPIPPYSPEQVEILHRSLDSSIIVAGGPCTGKTILAIMKARHIVDEGKRCLFIAGTSLSQKYVKHAFLSIGLSSLSCLTYYQATKDNSSYEVIIFDDAHLFSSEQIRALLLMTRYLCLFGDFERRFLYNYEDSIINDRDTMSGFHVYSLSRPFNIPLNFIRLIPRFSNSFPPSSDKSLPVISKVGSIDEQCLTVKYLIETMLFDNVGVLCYTRSLVKTVLEKFNSLGMQIEVYLPGREDRIDTLDIDSSAPKLMTIASSVGVHFNTVFILGFDFDIVWNNPIDVLETAITRATENLFVFYEKQLPEPVASLPPSVYKPLYHNNDKADLF